MIEQQPLVGWKDISAKMGVCEKTAKKILAKADIFLPDYAPRKAVYTFDLQNYLRRYIKTT